MTAAKTLRDDILKAARSKGVATKAELARGLRITPQYMGDIFSERRAFTAALVSRAAALLEVGGVRYRRWHRLGATEAGWQIDTRSAA